MVLRTANGVEVEHYGSKVVSFLTRDKKELVQIVFQRKVKALPLYKREKESSNLGKVDESEFPEQGKPIQCRGLVWLCYKMNLPRDVYFV